MAAIHFIGPLKRRGNYYCIVFPRFVSGELRKPSRIRVKGTINGGDYEGSAFPTGDGAHFILINAHLRQNLDLNEGDEIVVILDEVVAEEPQ
ncbi:MAG: DUF1905 domain-containing protein [Chloroflexi bacterium]|nr:DUF1905 domain-containing protein [Chloroflexota bacterium]